MAILCNHQRAVPKGHAGQMEKLSERMHKLNEELLELQHELKAAQKGRGYGDKKRRDPERWAVISGCLGLKPLCFVEGPAAPFGHTQHVIILSGLY